MNIDDLLELLADGQFHSGQALADRRGISRTAVWKHVAGLADLGIDVERVRGRGYRIAGGLKLLNEDLLRSQLSHAADAMLDELEILRNVDSTNLVLQRGVPPAPGQARVALAEMQTQGRGRRGKQWVSPFARNIYLSIDWQFAGGVQEIEGLSLAVGVAVATAAARFGAGSLQLKWPNDLLHDGKKLGGILVEMSGDAEGPCRTIIGIGINVDMDKRSDSALDQPWTDLAAVTGGSTPERNALAAAILDECLQLLDGYAREGFSAWQERWSRRDAFANQPVQLQSGPSSLMGIARGVDERGALRLETGQGVRLVGGGEMSLRPVS